jgi:serine/threonine-protein kinase
MIVRRATERLPDHRVPVPLVLNILAQSCAGLHYAHEKAMNGKALNIVHRDISPQNLVISFEGVVKVVDFGIAKAELRETRTRSGTIKGKFAYMSPEQCVANNVDRRTDVFALGVIAHELLTGRRLFKRPSPYETYQAVIECDVKPPSTLDASIDPALDPVILRATAKDKADRYPTAEAFGDALLGYLHHRGIGSGPGDVSRFFDTHFAQEIDEHSARMRELISGRDVVSVDTGVNWGSDDPEPEPEPAPEDEPNRAATPAQAKPPAGASNKARVRTPELDDLASGARGDDGDDLPAERTRIESNPLGKIDELERMVSAAPRALPAAPKLPPSRPLPLPPVPKPGPVARIQGMPSSGRFPELANLPTMIAEPDPDDVPNESPGSPDGMGFVDVATELAPSGVPPPAPGFAHAPMALAPPIVPPAGPGFAHAPAALAKTQIAPGPMGLPTYSSPNGMPPPGSQAPPIQHPAVAQGYPVMNAQLSAQIATGATVFPSGHHGSQPHGAPAASQGAPSMGPPPGPRNPEPGGPGGPLDPRSGPMFPHNGHPHDPSLGTGPPHPEHVPWGAATAFRVRAVPPWLLAVLFVGALGIALALTIAIAKIIR